MNRTRKNGVFGVTRQNYGQMRNAVNSSTGPAPLMESWMTPSQQRANFLQDPLTGDLLDGSDPHLNSLHKFRPPHNPIRVESDIPSMMPTPSVMEAGEKAEWDRFLLTAADPAQRTAYEIERHKGMKEQVSNSVKQAFNQDFRLWLAKRGQKEDHVNAGWWDAADPNAPKWMKLPGYLSDDPSVANYLHGFLEGQFDFERSIAQLKLEAQFGGFRNWPIEKLWLYYKFVVRGLNDASDEEIRALINCYPRPLDGNISNHGGKASKPARPPPSGADDTPASAGPPPPPPREPSIVTPVRSDVDPFSSYGSPPTPDPLPVHGDPPENPDFGRGDPDISADWDEDDEDDTDDDYDEEHYEELKKVYVQPEKQKVHYDPNDRWAHLRASIRSQALKSPQLSLKHQLSPMKLAIPKPKTQPPQAPTPRRLVRELQTVTPQPTPAYVEPERDPKKKEKGKASPASSKD